MAAQDPHGAETESLDCAVSLKRFERIGRTGWIVSTAGWQQRGNTDLVTSNQQHAERSHRSARNPGCPLTNGNHVDRQILESCFVRFWFGTNEEIDPTIQIRQQSRSNEFSQTPFYAVPVDDSAPMLGDDDPHPRMRQQGSRCPGLEVLGLNPLPCASDNFEIGLARQP